jgi:hypothetical protein
VSTLRADDSYWCSYGQAFGVDVALNAAPIKPRQARSRPSLYDEAML